MLYVGLDIHSKHIAVCVLDERGQPLRRDKVRSIDHMMNILEKLPKPLEACYEASCGYGHYYDLLKPLASRVVVAHPGHLRLIFRSKQKNDRRDAEKLAKLLYLGETPAVHVPQSEVRAWRELITCRARLICKRTVAKNGLRALLRSQAIAIPNRPGLWTKRGMAWVRDLELPTSTQRLRRDLLLEEIDALSRQIQRVEVELDRIADTQPSVMLLRSIPGVGRRTAEAVVAFLDVADRFKNAKAVGSYFGLVPSQDQSGSTNRLGRITRQGPSVVRQLLTEVSWQAIRRSPTVKAFYERVRRDDPDRKKIAVVATAHYLARVMWAMLKRGTTWKEQVQTQLSPA